MKEQRSAGTAARDRNLDIGDRMRQNRLSDGLVGVRSRIVVLSLLMSAASVLLQAIPCSAARAEDALRVRTSERYGKLPLQFEANRGQTDPEVKFLSRGAGYTFFLTPTEAVMVFTK